MVLVDEFGCLDAFGRAKSLPQGREVTFPTRTSTATGIRIGHIQRIATTKGTPCNPIYFADTVQQNFKVFDLATPPYVAAEPQQV
jgi:hypothetical protein